MKDVHNLSAKELRKAEVLQRIINKTITQKDAAQTLGITDRQVRRLLAIYRDNGTAGLANKARGKPSNRQLPELTKDKVLELVKTKYPDFGPTFASEKLAELDNLKIDHNTLRLLMIKEGLWHHKKRKPIHRTRRDRRACYGDMEQFDGCRHDWFEGRLPGNQVLIEERLDNSLHIRLKGYYLQHEKLTAKPAKAKQPIALTSNPGTNKQYTPTKPSPNHPWRKFTMLPYNVTNRPNQKRPSKKMS